jgi:hypothetical protein
MTKPDMPSGKESARAIREKRLAEALRANLRRRKAATRVPSSGASAEGSGPEPENAPDSAKDKG